MTAPNRARKLRRFRSGCERTYPNGQTANRMVGQTLDWPAPGAPRYGAAAASAKRSYSIYTDGFLGNNWRGGGINTALRILTMVPNEGVCGEDINEFLGGKPRTSPHLCREDKLHHFNLSIKLHVKLNGACGSRNWLKYS